MKLRSLLSKKSFLTALTAFALLATFQLRAQNTNDFITRWDLSKNAGSGPTQLSFGVATSGTVSYTWQEIGGSNLSGLGTFSGTNATITGLPTNGIIDVSISKTNFQRININGGTDRARLTQLKQWGTVAWTSMQFAFSGCTNFTLTATDVPNLMGVASMFRMFRDCSSFNQSLPAGFNTAAVTDMSSMFIGCSAYNQPLPAGFNTAAVIDMSSMFQGCSAYNQALPSSFNTAKVANMNSMFLGCSVYNQVLPGSFNTAAVKDMSGMFVGCIAYDQTLPTSFTTAAVTNMGSMFSGCIAYNQPLPSSFNTSAVTNMSSMFFGCNSYNQALPSSFTTAAVRNMSNMFKGCSAYNQPLPGNFNTAAVTNMSFMFAGCSVYNQLLPNSFNTAAVTDMNSMFQGCSAYNQVLPASFTTAAVTDMFNMFGTCSDYNQKLPSSFNTANVTNMRFMFGNCVAYNQPLPTSFNTIAVTNMNGMFTNCPAYNQPLPSSFNTSKVTDMGGMFLGSSAYNQAFPANFTTVSVISMNNMFSNCTAFDQNVGNFNITAATNISNMFNNSGVSIENYDNILTGWNTAGYTGKNLGSTFPLKYCAAAADRATLIKSIANGGKGWTIYGDTQQCPLATTTTTIASSLNPSTVGTNVTFTATVFPYGSTGTVTFKDGTTTIGTGTLASPQATTNSSKNARGILSDPGVSATFSTSALSAGTHSITAVYSGDASKATSTSAALNQVVTADPASFFITRWDLNKSAGSGATQLSFGVGTSGTVSYTWQQVGGSALSGSGTFTGNNATISGLPTGGIIDVSINPTNFQRISINGATDKDRLTQLRQWGTVAWTSMQFAFFGSTNFTLTATDVPNLTSVTNMNGMFGNCSSFNQALPNGFNTATVTNMGSMFQGCTSYNQALPISFSTAAVTNMNQMFLGCSTFNQSLPTSFNTAAVINMSNMFFGCSAFNQSLPTSFNTAAVTNMSGMFSGCIAYNQLLPANFNTAAVTDMSRMFQSCIAYNQLLPANFNTAAVTDMSFMFNSCSVYNQALPAGFATAAVTNMSSMFYACSAYNQSLPTGFTTAAVTNMSGMFTNCTAFNQPLPTGFTTAAVTDISYIFQGCTAFNQNVGSFDLTAATCLTDIFKGSGISTTNYDAILTAWNTAGYTGKNIGNTSPLKYCAAAADRANLVKPIADGGKGWTITGDAQLCTPVTITTQPTDQVVCESSTATFSLVTTGSPSGYQWYKNNVAVTGATSSSYTTPATTATNTGDKYKVIVNPSSSSPITSNEATLTVNTKPKIVVAPFILYNLCEGGSQTLNVTVNGTPTPTIQWEKGGVGIAGETGTSFTLSNVTTTDAGAYSVTATNSCGSDSYGPIQINVAAKPVITNQPTSATKCLGENQTFNVTATNAGSYQWKKDGVDISGQTSSSLVLNNVQISNAGNYSVVITGTSTCTSQSVTSNLATLMVNQEILIRISSNSPLCEGSELTLMAEVQNPVSTPIYSWTGPASFASSIANPTINGITPNQAGTYSLLVTDNGCSKTFTVEVVVNPLPTLPTITADNMSICKGGSAILSANCATAGASFRWSTPGFVENGVASLPSSSQRAINAPGVYKGFCESDKGCLGGEVSITIAQAANCNGQNFITILPEKPAICPNSSITLTASGCTGTLTWLGGPTTQTGTTATFSPAATTSYFVQCSTGGSTTVDVVVATTNVTVTNNITTGKERVKAIDSITSDKKVGDANFTPAPNVIYEAGKSIILLPGFTAEKFSIFKAEIKTCEPSNPD